MRHDGEHCVDELRERFVRLLVVAIVYAQLAVVINEEDAARRNIDLAIRNGVGGPIAKAGIEWLIVATEETLNVTQTT